MKLFLFVLAALAAVSAACTTSSECVAPQVCVMLGEATSGVCKKSSSMFEEYVCNHPIDLVLAVDVSGSISESEFTQYKRFVADLERQSERSQGTFRLLFFAEDTSAVMSTADAALALDKNEFADVKRKDVRKLDAWLEKQRKLGFNTNTNMLWRKARKQLFPADLYTSWPAAAQGEERVRAFVWLSDMKHQFASQSIERRFSNKELRRDRHADERLAADFMELAELHNVDVFGVDVSRTVDNARSYSRRASKLGERFLLSADAECDKPAGERCFARHVWFPRTDAQRKNKNPVDALPFLRTQLCYREFEQVVEVAEPPPALPTPEPRLPTPEPSAPHLSPCSGRGYDGERDTAAITAGMRRQAADAKSHQCAGVAAGQGLPSFERLSRVWPVMTSAAFRSALVNKSKKLSSKKRGNLDASYLWPSTAMRLTYSLREAGARCLENAKEDARGHVDAAGQAYWVDRARVEKVATFVAGREPEQLDLPDDVSEQDAFERIDQFLGSRRGVLSYSRCRPWDKVTTGHIDLWDGQRPFALHTSAGERLDNVEKSDFAAVRAGSAIDLFDSRCVHACPRRHFFACKTYRFWPTCPEQTTTTAGAAAAPVEFAQAASSIVDDSAADDASLF